ncbi:MAG: acyltransferase [Bacteroidia bacterium]|nr:acyltransferase [Bacteroidia bacterium]
MSTNENRKSKALPNLGPLRGFLALTVVLLHIPLMTKNQYLPYFNDWAIFNKGYNAVWGFFTLSGFLIINLLYQEKQKTFTVNVKDFYTRRILRIYPVYYVVLLFGLAYYHFILPQFGIKFETNYTVGEAFLWCIAFLPNVFFSLFDPGGILSILWSIGIEEQFYLMIAPISKFIKSNKFTIILASFTVLYFILYFNPYTEFFRRYRFMYFYFSMGGLMAILHSQQKINFLIFPKLLRLVLYVSFVLYFFTNVFEFSNEALKHAFSMVLFALFILNISNEKDYIINNKFMNYLGEISYGIYMYHMIALNLIVFISLKINVEHIFGFIGTVVFINITTIGLTILFSHLSFYYFEKAFINLKSKFRKSTSSNDPKSLSSITFHTNLN